MITVTDSALEHLAATKSRVHIPSQPAACFRLAPDEKGGMRLLLDQPAQGDHTFEHRGEVVLAGSEELARQLDGRTLDTGESGTLALS